MSTAPLVVVGDALLDADVEGRVRRISPEPPAVVLDEERTVLRPGGAALAALLLSRLAPTRPVVLVAPRVHDQAGDTLIEVLASRCGGLEFVPLSARGATVEKRRIRGEGRTMLRVDRGHLELDADQPGRMRALLGGAAAVLVADYGQGTTTHAGVREALDVARTVVWDPHPRGGSPLAGVRVVTPNQDEAATVLDRAVGTKAERLVAARELRTLWASEAVALTCGQDGIALSDRSSARLIPARPVEGDACGAGDAFAAAMTLALADGATVEEAARAAVGEATGFVASGGAMAVTEHAGSATVGAAGDDGLRRSGIGVVERVRAAGGTVVATGGCFDLLHAGHVEVLDRARQLGDCLVVLLNSDASVRRLKGPGRPIVGERDRRRVLEALSSVDAVVLFDEPTPVLALRRLRPDVWVKGGDYTPAGMAEEPALREWSAQIVTFPLLPDHSSTRLIERTIANAAEHGSDERTAS